MEIESSASSICSWLFINNYTLPSLYCFSNILSKLKKIALFSVWELKGKFVRILWHVVWLLTLLKPGAKLRDLFVWIFFIFLVRTAIHTFFRVHRGTHSCGIWFKILNLWQLALRVQNKNYENKTTFNHW